MCYILLSGKTSESRSGHAHQRIKQKQQNRHIQSYPSCWPPAQRHTSRHTEANLGFDCCPRRVRQQVKINKIVWRGSSEEPTMLYITTAYSTFGKRKSLKIIDWSHRSSVQSEADDRLHSTVYRQEVKLNKERGQSQVENIRNYNSKTKNIRQKRQKTCEDFQTLFLLFYLFTKLLVFMFSYSHNAS